MAVSLFLVVRVVGAVEGEGLRPCIAASCAGSKSGETADTETGLNHVGAREYDPTTGRFLTVDPVLAPDDHESLNGYAYANSTPVTASDPTGLRPDGMCGGSSGHCNGGTEYYTKNSNGWAWHYTKTYTNTFT